MKGKNRGFSLLELLVSMALLTFVLVISSALFDRAIQVDKNYDFATAKTAEGYSKLQSGIDNAIEYMDYHMKKEKGSSGKTEMPDGYTDPIKIRTNLKIKPTKTKDVLYTELEGYTVGLEKGRYSYRTDENGKKVIVEGLKVGYNNIDDKTKAVTFVGRGNTLSESSHVDIKLDKNDTSIFEFFPINSKDKEIKLNYDVDNSSKQYIKTRINYLKSPDFSEADNSLFKPYFNMNKYYERVGFLTPSSYEYAKEATETDEKVENGIVNWKIDSFSKDREKYFQSIDKSHAASAITLNSNGKISPEDASFDTEIPVKHFIGLPFTENLGFFADFNLMIARDDKYEMLEGEKVKIVQYLNTFLNADKNYFNNSIKNIKNPVRKGKEDYRVKFENSSDVRDIINVKKTFDFGNNFELAEGFLPEIEIEGGEYAKDKNGQNNIKYPFAIKSYGSSVYYEPGKKLFEKYPQRDFTAYVKLNNLNYEKLDLGQEDKIRKRDFKIAPYVILTNNINIETGELINDKKEYGNMIYIAEDGNIHLYEKKGKKFLTERDNVIAKTGLYDDTDQVKLNNLSEFKMKYSDNYRDAREGFNICQIIVGSRDYTFRALCRDDRSKNLRTSVVEFSKEIVQDEKLLSSSENYLSLFPGYAKFKIRGKNAYPVEISDILVYDKKMDDAQSVITMNYLFRKYLTTEEKKNFDNYYKTLF